MLRYFGSSLLVTIAAVVVALLTLGPAAALTTLVLIAIEIAFSFDNAIINAKVLERLSHAWQHAFLTIGMVIAILGMRIVFPIAIVMVTAHLPWGQVIDDALHHPEVYGRHLAEAQPAISAFGGSFLLTLALYFLFDDVRQELWLVRIERRLQAVRSGVLLPPLLVIIIITFVALFAGDAAGVVFRSGLFGVAAYAGINLFIAALSKVSGGDETGKKLQKYTGWGAFGAFMYLQVLDASFSFDGVLGAFAISNKIVLIALGLGVGALWVRSLTVFIVRKGTLKNYIYLEHGAHYAILVLSVALLGSIFYEVPDAITGIVGLGVILASFMASREALQARQHPTKK